MRESETYFAKKTCNFATKVRIILRNWNKQNLKPIIDTTTLLFFKSKNCLGQSLYVGISYDDD